MAIKYRIKPVPGGYCPQYKKFIIWRNFYVFKDNQCLQVYFASLKGATLFIFSKIKENKE